MSNYPNKFDYSMLVAFGVTLLLLALIKLIEDFEEKPVA